MIDYGKLQKAMLAAALKGKKAYLLGKSIKYSSAVFVTFGGEDRSAIGFYVMPDSVFLMDAEAYMKAIDQKDFLKMDTLIKEEENTQPAYTTLKFQEVNGFLAQQLVSEDYSTVVYINRDKLTEYIKPKSEICYAVTNAIQPVFFTADFPGSEFPFDGAILPVRIK